MCQQQLGEVPAGEGIGFGAVGFVDGKAEVLNKFGQAAGRQVGEHEAGKVNGAELFGGGTLEGEAEAFAFGLGEAVVEAEVVGGEDAAAEAAVVAGPEGFGGCGVIDHGLGDAGEAGDAGGDGDAGVDQVGGLFVDAVAEAGVEDGNFDGVGFRRSGAGSFEIKNCEGLLGEVAVLGEQLQGVHRK